MSTQFLTISGGRIAYDVTGPADAPLVVCTPGMGDVRAAYRFVTPALLQAGYRVATMDLRGHGESSVGWDDVSSAAIGSDLVALVEHLGGPAVLVGNSYAAAATVWAAAQAPDAVVGIALTGPFVRDGKQNAFARLATKLVGRSATLWTAFHKTLYKGDKPADFAEYTKALKATMSEPGRMPALAGMFASSHAACEARLPEVRCATQIVMGTKDPDFPDPTAEAAWIEQQLAPRVPSVSVRMVEGCGHYPHAEYPEITTDTLLTFLKEVHGV
ncbi:alpha/beta hydrolase [Solihabitans fulvus]|uniref:Alpha/beta hydrolase n=1 Tax=Solihabitans fulvus TaxID=1892852 RepID=A0A5B2WT33_9PSEU|nr:alpha/beta hydrolase [Solihabitans fulvus]KAA2253569.1 alpha/beta hydrolase [Solihabitans fulvus]